jgi:hypothetical protein
LERLLHLEIWACHGPTQHLQFALQPDWTTTPPLEQLHHYMFVEFEGFMVNVEVWAGVNTFYTPDCMNVVPVLLTWHSTLYNRQPLHTIATHEYSLLWEGWAVMMRMCL